MTPTDLKNKLLKSVDFLKADLNQVRTGRANPSLLEDVRAEAYGSTMSIKELGTIVVQDPQNIIISPWDKGLVSSISKAIREAGLNLNPVEDSDKIRVPLPALTEERRKELTKVVTTKAEECKNALRNVRQDAMKDVDKSFGDKQIGEDEKFRLKEEIEDIVKDCVSQVDDLAEAKKKDLMTV